MAIETKTFSIYAFPNYTTKLPLLQRQNFLRRSSVISVKKINQKRSYLHTKNGFPEKIFTPFPTSSYENLASRIENLFRINRACSFNYRGSDSLFSKWKLFRGTANAIRLTQINNYQLSIINNQFSFVALAKKEAEIVYLQQKNQSK
jgi:hypothetical protein